MLPRARVRAYSRGGCAVPHPPGERLISSCLGLTPALLRAGRLAPVIPLAFFGFGCSDASSAAGTTTAEDWSAEVELRIGSVDDPQTALTGVGAILTGDGGRFYVTQPQDGHVRIHGPGGEFHGRFGGRGEGPGEFQGLSAIGWWGGGRDTLWASDFQLRRVSLFSADGTFIRSIPITTPPYQEVMRVSVQTILPDGTGLGLPSYPSRLLADGQIRSIPVLRFSLTGGEPEVVVATEPGNRQLALEFGTGMSFSSQPYGDSPLTAASGEAGRVVVVERPAAAQPTDARFRVTALKTTGDTLWSREYPYQPLPVPTAEADSMRDERIERSMDFATRMGASHGDVERQVREKLYLPAFRPPPDQRPHLRRRLGMAAADHRTRGVGEPLARPRSRRRPDRQPRAPGKPPPRRCGRVERVGGRDGPARRVLCGAPSGGARGSRLRRRGQAVYPASISSLVAPVSAATRTCLRPPAPRRRRPA
jgi:hypothetical protein